MDIENDNRFHLKAYLHLEHTRRTSFPLSYPLSYNILQFWTLALEFKHRINTIFDQTASIVGEQDTEAGTIKVDGHEGTSVLSMTDPLGFIPLSEGFQGCYVMLLECSGSVAERRGLGIIQKPTISLAAWTPMEKII